MDLTDKAHSIYNQIKRGDIEGALRVQRVKVQTVAGVKVGRDGLGVVVDQNGFAAVLLQGDVYKRQEFQPCGRSPQVDYLLC